MCFSICFGCYAIIDYVQVTWKINKCPFLAVFWIWRLLDMNANGYIIFEKYSPTKAHTLALEKNRLATLGYQGKQKNREKWRFSKLYSDEIYRFFLLIQLIIASLFIRLQNEPMCVFSHTMVAMQSSIELGPLGFLQFIGAHANP